VTAGTCRCCDGPVQLLADRGDVVLYRCAACHVVSARPADGVDPAGRYATHYDRAEPPPPDAQYAAWLRRAEALVGRGRLLEVGAGSGGFVRAALARGWRVDATEVSASGLARLRATEATVHAGDLLAACLPARAFDLVVCLEVLEHLPAPVAHLIELSRVTRPGGLLLATTPNFDGLSRRVLGLRWRVVAPEHLVYFTPRTLARAIRTAGFTRARVHARSLDVTTWRRTGPAGFDPHAAARVRETIVASPALRFARRGVDAALGLTGLGDSLLAWGHR